MPNVKILIRQNFLIFVLFTRVVSQFVKKAFRGICGMLITDIELFAAERFINCKISKYFKLYKL